MPTEPTDTLPLQELQLLSAEERAELEALLAADTRVWRPLPGPQSLAQASHADIIGYGGAAGGGKTDLLCGLALTEHERVLIIRREKAQTVGIVQRLTEILGTTDGYTTQGSQWVVPRRGTLIEFGGLDHPGDENRWQGRPHDAIFLDEVTEMREGQVRFLLGWNRTGNEAQRKRVLMTFNPPMTVEGRWIIAFFAPWLDRKHPRPAAPGEIRWFTTIEGKDREVPDNRPFVLGDKDASGEHTIVYEFDPATTRPELILRPLSRTFIPARITDNPYYANTNYMATVQAMPEPMRSRLLFGDFDAGIEDDPYQVIPTRWVEAAMKAWKERAKKPPMDCLGCDVAMRGKDKTVIARRHGMWFDRPIAYKGSECPDGATIAGYCAAALRDRAPIHIDLFGVGADPYGQLMGLQLQVVGVVMGDPTAGVMNRRIQFDNVRSEIWWRMREALDPQKNTGIELPDDRELLADLCAPKFEIKGNKICVQSRDEIVEELGRSPDYGTAYVLALMDTPKRHVSQSILRGDRVQREYDPYRDI